MHLLLRLYWRVWVPGYLARLWLHPPTAADWPAVFQLQVSFLHWFSSEVLYFQIAFTGVWRSSLARWLDWTIYPRPPVTRWVLAAARTSATNCMTDCNPMDQINTMQLYILPWTKFLCWITFNGVIIILGKFFKMRRADKRTIPALITAFHALITTIPALTMFYSHPAEVVDESLGNAMARNMKTRPGRNPYLLVLVQAA